MATIEGIVTLTGKNGLLFYQIEGRLLSLSNFSLFRQAKKTFRNLHRDYILGCLLHQAGQPDGRTTTKQRNEFITKDINLLVVTPHIDEKGFFNGSWARFNIFTAPGCSDLFEKP